MAAGAYSLAAPAGLGIDVGSAPAAPQREVRVTQLDPHVARPVQVQSHREALVPAAGMVWGSERALTPAMSDNQGAVPVPLSVILMASAVWIFALVRRRWVTRG